MKWPTAIDVEFSLRQQHRSLTFGLDEKIDVRLQVEGGGWALHVGDPAFDQDDRGWWGAGSMDLHTDLQALAEDLLEQCKEDEATAR